MPYDKKKRAVPSKKRKLEKQMERMPQGSSQRAGHPDEVGATAAPSKRQQRQRPGEGVDKSDEGVIAGSRLAGRRPKS
jgi:hypothetical protein